MFDSGLNPENMDIANANLAKLDCENTSSVDVTSVSQSNATSIS